MTEIILDTNQQNGREFRTVTASTKVTDQELAHLETAAAARGVRLGEWIRGVLLREARSSSAGLAAEPLMVEIIAVQMFLTRALSSIACGDRMTPEQYQELIQNVKAHKYRAAREVVAQHANESREESHD
jgi:DNA-binding GntR family transcriptional regulator